MTQNDGTTFYQDCDRVGCWIKNHAAPFALLQDAFEGAIRPTDIDGMVERKGHFLTLEWKEDDTPIPQGQRILFENFTRLVHPDPDGVPACVVLVVWHTKDKPAEVLRYATFSEGRFSQPRAATLAQVWEVCFNWYTRIEPSFNNQRETQRRRFQARLDRLQQ